jgi:hypothetical protein
MAIGECFNRDRLDLDCHRRRSIGHHLYWPGSDYITPLEKAFRQLSANILQICECAEKELHLTMEPPEKPTVVEMIMACTVQFEGQENGV